jgi:hypothetical protein
VELAYPKADNVIYLFTDASDGHWGVMLTQTYPDQVNLAIPGQVHEPLALLSGFFAKTQLPWSVIEKEAFHYRQSASLSTLLKWIQTLHRSL